MLALTQSIIHKGKERPICKIVSEPYKMDVETCNGRREYEFITVTYDDLLHTILYDIDLVNKK
jgi:hypothetical protein